MTGARDKIRVLIVDDSAIVRSILSESLAAEPDLTVVGAAPDPYIARDKILALEPDVVTLDVDMPRMDGLTFLTKLMRFHPLPVIIISSLGQSSCHMAIEALRLGAVEVLAKPSSPCSVGELRTVLANKIRAAAAARLRCLPEDPPGPASASAPAPVSGSFNPATIVAMGASTGGTEAIRKVLVGLPEDFPGILVVQHIPAGFSRAFAQSLNQLCRMEVKEACDGDLVASGRVLIAPGDYHMLLRRSGTTPKVVVKGGPRVNYQRPSVDVLFSSVAEDCEANAVGVLLTGMGSDGAQGLLRMKRSGAFTIAQDESTSVVFGMPREAARLGGVCQVLPLGQVRQAVLDAARP